MKKVGTITAALGFIFLGVWLVIKNSNNNLANNIFKWWPILIILLGVEILFYYSSKNNADRIGFNGLVILVILIFIGINTTQFVSEKFGLGIKWLGNSVNISDGIDFLSGINDNNYKTINSNITLESYGKSISFDADNLDIRVKKSSDNKIKIEANIFVDKNHNEDRYDIKANKQSGGYFISLKEGYIKKSEVYLYVPEGINVNVQSNNLRVKSEDVFNNINYVIKANNGYAELNGGDSADLDYDNGSIKIIDIKNIKVNSNNGSFNFDGNCENIYLRANNGSLTVNNKITKNIDASINLGTIKYSTEDKNVSVDVSISHGAIDINGIKKVNTPMSIVTGTGEGKAKIHIDNGTVTVRNQE